MHSRSLFLILFTTLFFHIFCENTISGYGTDIYTEKELMGVWCYGDTCFLCVYITYTFTDSTCTEEKVYIGSKDCKRVSDNTIIFQDWLVQNDSLFLIFDTSNTNDPENEIHRFNFNDDGNLLLTLEETNIWLEFVKENQQLK